MDCLLVHPSPAKISPPIPPPPSRGDPFTALYRIHRAFVRSLLLAMGVANANVDDLTQDVFTVVFRRGVYPPDAEQTRAWLYAITVRIVSNHRTRKSYTMENVVAEPPELTRYPRIGEVIDARRWIRRVLERLSPKLRAVFVAFELEWREMVEIARELGIKLKTAWSRMKLARDEIERWIAWVWQGHSLA